MPGSQALEFEKIDKVLHTCHTKYSASTMIELPSYVVHAHFIRFFKPHGQVRQDGTHMQIDVARTDRRGICIHTYTSANKPFNTNGEWWQISKGHLDG